MKFPRAAGLLVGLFILLAYASVLLGGPYGVNDDYQYLQRVYTGTFDPAHNEQTGMGRPAAAWLLQAAYQLCAGSVVNLVFIRLAALGGILLFTATLYWTLRRAGQGPGMALTMAACVAFSPACGVYAAWAAAFLCPYALTLCLLAGALLETPPASPRPRSFSLRAGGAALFILLACCLWQAAAPLALFAGFAGAWGRSKDHRLPVTTQMRPALSTLAVVGASVLAYLLVQRLAVFLDWTHGAGSDRLALASDWRAKGRLLGELLRSGFGSWARLHSLFWQVPVAGLTALACAAAIVGGRSHAAGAPARPALLRAGLAAGMILASVSPLLAANENNAAYRSLPVLYAVVAFLLVEGADRCTREMPARGRLATGGALIVLLGGNAALHVRYGIVEPNVREYRAVSQLVRRQFRAMPPRLVYLPPSPVLLVPDAMIPSWEYGLSSSSFWWVTKPFLLLVFHDQGMCPEPQPARLELCYREAGNAALPVLNPMPAMLGEPGSWQEDPRWGRVQAFSGGWRYSPWFGCFNVREFPVLQHHILGSLLCIGERPDNLWFHKTGFGNFHTSKVSFPYLYLGEEKGWVYLLDTDRSHCAVRDAANRSWLLSREPGPLPANRAAATIAASAVPDG